MRARSNLSYRKFLFHKFDAIFFTKYHPFIGVVDVSLCYGKIWRASTPHDGNIAVAGKGDLLTATAGGESEILPFIH